MKQVQCLGLGVGAKRLWIRCLCTVCDCGPSVAQVLCHVWANEDVAALHVAWWITFLFGSVEESCLNDFRESPLCTQAFLSCFAHM